MLMQNDVSWGHASNVLIWYTSTLIDKEKKTSKPKKKKYFLLLYRGLGDPYGCRFCRKNFPNYQP